MLAPSVAGHSIGRWEGDVLVVDTVGFAPGVLSADAVTMHSDRLHVVERFCARPRGRRLTARRTWRRIHCIFSGQYTGSDNVFIADLPYESYNCDERGYVTAGGGPAAASPADRPAGSTEEEPSEPAKPWWMFWK